MNTKRKNAGLFFIPLLFFISAGCPEHAASREYEPQVFFAQYVKGESGVVRGKILDFKSGTVVTLENDLSLFTCHPDPLTGEFEFKPVEPGTYTLHVYEAGQTNPFSIRGIVVGSNQIVNLGPLENVL